MRCHYAVPGSQPGSSAGVRRLLLAVTGWLVGHGSVLYWSLVIGSDLFAVKLLEQLTYDSMLTGVLCVTCEWNGSGLPRSLFCSA